jgi:hypothetical protein
MKILTFKFMTFLRFYWHTCVGYSCLEKMVQNLYCTVDRVGQEPDPDDFIQSDQDLVKKTTKTEDPDLFSRIRMFGIRSKYATRS